MGLNFLDQSLSNPNRIKGINEVTPMTRRYPNLKQKVLRRDSEIARKIINANNDHDPEKILQIFLKEQNNLSDERYWELMRSVWVTIGSTKLAPTFKKLMESNRPQKFYFSTPEEAKKLRDLPNEFEVFRATDTIVGDEGISWTLLRRVAEDFKKSWGKKFLLSKIINKKQVFAIIERGGEEEIIIL